VNVPGLGNASHNSMLRHRVKSSDWLKSFFFQRRRQNGTATATTTTTSPTTERRNGALSLKERKGRQREGGRERDRWTELKSNDFIRKNGNGTDNRKEED
jgi:hypothetical protein